MTKFVEKKKKKIVHGKTSKVPYSSVFKKKAVPLLDNPRSTHHLPLNNLTHTTI